MNLERTQYIGRYGVTLSVIRSTVKPNGKQALSDLISRKPCNLHSADIVIGLDAQASGGIDPQRSSISMHVYSNEP